MFQRFQGFLATFLLGAFAFLGNSCSTDFEVYAPYEDIVAVYGILNPGDSIQYIVVSKAYQIEGNAITHGQENDHSLKGINVKLSGAGHVYNAVQMDSFPKELIDKTLPQNMELLYYPYRTVYMIYTDSTNGPPLVEGRTYTLEVGTQDTGIYVSATTIVPEASDLSNTQFRPSPSQGNLQALKTFGLNEDLPVKFKFGSAIGFELKLVLHYYADGVADSAIWGPTDVFEGNTSCVSPSSKEYCYNIREYSISSVFNNKMGDDNVTYTYDDQPKKHANVDSLSKAFYIELTSIDVNLRNYMLANNPKVFDLTGAKPEWTNISGNVRAVGVFGSYTRDREYIAMDACSEYILDLNGQPDPGQACVKIE